MSIQRKTIQFLKLTCTISFLCMILHKTKWYNNTQIYIFHKNKFHIGLQTRSQKIFKLSDVEIWTERRYVANFVSDFVFWFSTSNCTAIKRKNPQAFRDTVENTESMVLNQATNYVAIQPPLSLSYFSSLYPLARFYLDPFHPSCTFDLAFVSSVSIKIELNRGELFASQLSQQLV